MKRIMQWSTGILAAAFAASTALAQPMPSPSPVTLAERNLGGPRLGITYVPEHGALSDELKSRGMGPFISQFGWHFEYQVIPEGGGPCFVVQFVPLIAGVEYGKLIPSASLPLGVRLPNGIEFGLGPNVLVGGKLGITTSLVSSVGKSFNYGGVSIPLNLVVATNPEGSRFSIIFGYSILKP